MMGTGVISLSKELTRNCLSRLRSMNEFCTWSLTGVDKTSGLAEHQAARVRLGLRSSPEAAPKSVPLDALAKHLVVRQHGQKL